ncbi:hypothetical protein [Lacimicrobium alkaliphilum]|uniref:Uncharacterized protein n=1 Tax=Lacimicrobium alkaliphilum TaxID=1526571 RepID=A0ABQ1RD10_9ALTE|nr:hypothetical protein [Lacimicrobium alkaliphilum]GGD64244.1 hypothetical protein GCM10011357_19560 [Lacimicrobium alkaliphilum]
MLQLVAAIPGILNAVGKVSELFSKGKEAVKEITGQPSLSSTPEELQTEIQHMPVDQQNRWAEIMAKEVDKYVAQNERLAIEIGLIDKSLTENLSQGAASHIAMMRMTTRPWAVRWMVYYVLFPFFLVMVDLIQHLIVTWLPFLKRWIEPFNAFEYVFGVMRFPESADPGALDALARMFTEGQGPATFAGKLYVESMPWVVGIIISYMGLREIGKARGVADKAPEGQLAPHSVVKSSLTQGISLVSDIRSWFRK